MLSFKFFIYILCFFSILVGVSYILYKTLTSKEKFTTNMPVINLSSIPAEFHSFYLYPDIRQQQLQVPDSQYGQRSARNITVDQSGRQTHPSTPTRYFCYEQLGWYCRTRGEEMLWVDRKCPRLRGNITTQQACNAIQSMIVGFNFETSLQLFFACEKHYQEDVNRQLGRPELTPMLYDVFTYYTPDVFNTLDSDLLFICQTSLYLNMIRYVQTLTESNLTNVHYINTDVDAALSFDSETGQCIDSSYYRFGLDVNTARYRQTLERTYILDVLLDFIPDGRHDNYQFLLLLSIYNLVTNEDVRTVNFNIIKPYINSVEWPFTKYNPSIVNSNPIVSDSFIDQLTRGVAIPVISPSIFRDLILGFLGDGLSEDNLKPDWNGSMGNANDITRNLFFGTQHQMTNENGETIRILPRNSLLPSNVILTREWSHIFINKVSLSILDSYKPFEYNKYGFINTIQPWYINHQAVCLRKQDFNRKINLAKCGLFNTSVTGASLPGSDIYIENYTRLIGTNNGCIISLKKYRENILDQFYHLRFNDSSGSGENLLPSGFFWYAVIVLGNYLNNDRLKIQYNRYYRPEFPSILMYPEQPILSSIGGRVVRGQFSLNDDIQNTNLVTIQGLEGYIKPVINHSQNRGTIASDFGNCRSSTSVDGTKVTRIHAAVDLYGPNCSTCNNGEYQAQFNTQTTACSGGCSNSTQTKVYAPFYGIVIGKVNTYFKDQCKPNPNKFEETCPSQYTCTNVEGEKYCMRNGYYHYLPCLWIKHVDGTIGIYAEFYIKEGISIGYQVFTGERIGYLSQYTDQCHTELYMGTTNGNAWILGGHPSWDNVSGRVRNKNITTSINDYFKGEFSKSKLNTILKNCRLQNSDLSMSVTPMRLELPKFFKRMVQQNIVTIDSSNYMDYINLLWYLYCGIPNKSLSTQQRTCACNSCSYNQYLNTSNSKPCAWLRRNDLVNNFNILTLWRENLLTASWIVR